MLPPFVASGSDRVSCLSSLDPATSPMAYYATSRSSPSDRRRNRTARLASRRRTLDDVPARGCQYPRPLARRWSLENVRLLLLIANCSPAGKNRELQVLR